MKKSLLFISALCLGASSGFAQLDTIPNEGFEAWTGIEPDGWKTANSQVAPFSLQFVSQGSGADANTGASAIVLKTVFVTPLSATVPGVAVSGGTSISQTTGIKGGIKFRQRPVALTGMSKYTAGGAGDLPNVGVILTRWNGTSRDTLGGGQAQPSGTTWGAFTVPITYVKLGLTAVAPDSAQIILASSGQTGAVANSMFYVDGLAWDYGCVLEDGINSTAGNDQFPAPGDTLEIPADGAPYTRTWTIFIPKSVSTPVPATIDSVQILTTDLTNTSTATIPAGATYTITTNWPNGMIGAGTIACVTVTGQIPAGNNLIIQGSLVPRLWGNAAGIGALADFPNPNPTISYIKVGTGDPADGIDTFSASGGFSVSQNTPNPFDASTNINFNCTVSGSVDFVVTDVLGRQVYDTSINATVGSNTFVFTTDVAAGTYFFSLSDGTNTITRKMVITE